MSKTKGKTLADLRAAHDRKVVVPNKIKAAIQALAASGDEWIYEQEFLTLVKPAIGTTDIAKYRGQFEDFWAEMPTTNGRSTMRRVWFSSKKAADEWKETVSG
jgi:hypothetical protein